MAHYYACKFGLNRLRIDGDIRQKAAITAIRENVVIAIYRLRPIQLESTQTVQTSADDYCVLFSAVYRNRSGKLRILLKTS